jgi:hypothetical protein
MRAGELSGAFPCYSRVTGESAEDRRLVLVSPASAAQGPLADLRQI